MTHASNFTTQFLSVEAMRYWATMRKTISVAQQEIGLKATSCKAAQQSASHLLPVNGSPARALLARLM